jgi:hypothetical protein
MSTNTVDAIPTPASMPVELDYTQPVTTIPSGYRTVNFKQLNYNTIPQDVKEGQEIIINIPPIPNGWIDPSTTYLSLKLTIKGKYLENRLFNGNNSEEVDSNQYVIGRTNSEKVSLNHYAASINKNGGFDESGEVYEMKSDKGLYFSKLKSIGYFNSNSWCLFRRYQLYANNSKLLEDIDEIGKLASIMNPLTRSQSTYTSSHAHLDDVTGVYPGHRFAILRSFVCEGGDIADAGRLQIGSKAFGIWPVAAADSQLTEAQIDSVIDSNFKVNGDGSVRYPSAYDTDEKKFTRMHNALMHDFAYKRSSDVFIQEASGEVYLPISISEHIIPEYLRGDSVLQAAPLSLQNLCLDSQGFHIWANQLLRHDHNKTANRTVYQGLVDSISGTDVTGKSWIGADNFTTWSHTVDVTLPLIGILGANNEKLYPCTYPTQIRLITEDVKKFVSLPPTMYDVTLSIPKIEFCCNYLRLDSGAMTQVLQSLPIPGVIPMRTTSFTHSSVLLDQNVSGPVQQLVSSRRASMKALFISFEKLDATMVAEGVYNSVNPNLGSNTYLQVNGIYYPQMMLNPSESPADCYNQLLTTLNMTQSALLRPSIHYNNYLRSDQPIQGFNPIAKKATLAGSLTEYSIQHLGFSGSLRHIDKSFAVCRKIIKKGFEGVDEGYFCGRNQFYLAIDTEHFGRRGFLSGISTLGGSCFMNLNITQPLSTAFLVHYFNFHDMLIAFNLNTGDVEVKI